VVSETASSHEQLLHRLLCFFSNTYHLIWTEVSCSCNWQCYYQNYCWQTVERQEWKEKTGSDGSG